MTPKTPSNEKAAASKKKTSKPKTTASKAATTKTKKPTEPSKAAKPKAATSKPASRKTKDAQPKTDTDKGRQTMSEVITAEAPDNATRSPRTGALIRGKFRQYVPAADEDYMSAAQLEHFKLILNDWKQELMNEVDRTVDHMKDESANLPDPADRATQEEEFSLELRTRDRERKLIKKIDKTLESIEVDEYGFCEDCGVEIGLRRLEARPTATLCIDCKTLAEIKEKQYRS